MPGWPGMERFSGRIVHPQKWPEDLDYDGKRVVVIGSGATAVTIVPAMASRASHVTMLQRSPTYVVARPAEEALDKRFRKRLPTRVASGIIRWKNIVLQMHIYRLSRRKPAAMRAQIIKLAQTKLGPELDAAEYFNPRYELWDQRLCLIPDGDLFGAMLAGKASIVNSEIEIFTRDWPAPHIGPGDRGRYYRHGDRTQGSAHGRDRHRGRWSASRCRDHGRL